MPPRPQQLAGKAARRSAPPAGDVVESASSAESAGESESTGESEEFSETESVESTSESVEVLKDQQDAPTGQPAPGIGDQLNANSNDQASSVN